MSAYFVSPTDESGSINMKTKSLLSSLLLLTLLFGVQSTSLATVIANSNINNGIAWESRVIPYDPTAIFSVQAEFILAAHPLDTDSRSGTKSLSGGTFLATGNTGPDAHGTTGTHAAKSTVSVIGLPNGAPALYLQNSALARVNPGINPLRPPVTAITSVSDPLSVPAGFGSFTIQAILASGTTLGGLQQGIATDTANISSDFRINTGAPDLTDIYEISVELSGDSGLIIPSVTLGSNNSLFSLSFDRSLSEINDAIVSAFDTDLSEPGVLTYEVLSDVLLFTATVTPVQDVPYSFEINLNGTGSSNEVPEPAILTLLLFGTFLLSAKRKAI